MHASDINYYINSEMMVVGVYTVDEDIVVGVVEVTTDQEGVGVVVVEDSGLLVGI